MAKSSTLRMVLISGGLIGAVVAALAIKERFFDGETMVEIEIAGAPCHDGVLDPMLTVKISGDDFFHQQAYGGGAAPFRVTLPESQLDEELKIELGTCRQVHASTIDCTKPTPIPGYQMAKLDRTKQPAQLRVMFPGDLACRR